MSSQAAVKSHVKAPRNGIMMTKKGGGGSGVFKAETITNVYRQN